MEWLNKLLGRGKKSGEDKMGGSSTSSQQSGGMGGQQSGTQQGSGTHETEEGSERSDREGM